MSDWEIKDADNPEYIPIPSKPENPLTPERLQKLKEEADKRLFALYNALTNPSGSMDAIQKN